MNLIQLRKRNNKNQKEIAEILKISDSNAEKIFYRAKEKIKL